MCSREDGESPNVLMIDDGGDGAWRGGAGCEGGGVQGAGRGGVESSTVPFSSAARNSKNHR